jgi:hypothetical protein
MAKPTPQNAVAATSIERVGELELPEPVGQDLRRIEAALLVWPEAQLSHDGSDFIAGLLTGFRSAIVGM